MVMIIMIVMNLGDLGPMAGTLFSLSNIIGEEMDKLISTGCRKDFFYCKKNPGNIPEKL
jgi:hypothetical protein